MKSKYLSTFYVPVLSNVEANKASLALNQIKHSEDTIEQIRHYFTLAPLGQNYLTEGKKFVENMIGTKNNDPVLWAYKIAMDAIEAKYKTWVVDKFTIVTSALNRLDNLITQNPDQIEIRFLRMAVCSNLPPIFNKKSQIVKDISYILDLVRKNPKAYSKSYLNYMFEFMLNKKLISAHEIPYYK